MSDKDAKAAYLFAAEHMEQIYQMQKQVDKGGSIGPLLGLSRERATEVADMAKALFEGDESVFKIRIVKEAAEHSQRLSSLGEYTYFLLQLSFNLGRIDGIMDCKIQTIQQGHPLLDLLRKSKEGGEI